MISPRRRVLYDSNHTSRHKKIFKLSCIYCDTLLTTRSTQSALLSDPTKSLYSADIVINASKLEDQNFKRATCGCSLFDVFCMICGNVIGYYVKRPCDGCLSGHNGHFHVFLKDKVTAKEMVKSLPTAVVKFEDVYR
eukprot:NODE_101_length_19951_cov_0.932501.p14 type:complete len:137 gc:universal NODE_101_length_19951_cov_0.932501:503-93(-)